MDAVDAPFSVRTFHLSTSRTTDVLIKYELADGSSCRQVAFSSPEGVDVDNDQCGGAISVEFTLPEESKFGECDLNIHTIDFDCSSGPKPPPMATSSESLVPSTIWSTVPSTSWSIVPSLHTHSASVMEISTTDMAPMTTSTVWTTHVFTVTKCPPTVTNCPDHSTEVVTSTYSVSTTVCPSPAVTGASHITTSAIISTPAEPTSSVVPAPCPDLVPMCMNTWLSIPKCDSNSDTACFCPSSEFADKVKSCIHAWGTSEQETQSALSYFAGICAPYVPKNPSIIELPPTTSHVSSVHMPTSSWATTTPTPEAPCTTLTWSSHTMTVPHVVFSTVTVSSTTSVCLVPGVQTIPPTTPPTTTSYKTTHAPSTMTTCSSHASASSTTTAATRTTPTPTEVLSNTGSKTSVSSIWAGMAMLIICLL